MAVKQEKREEISRDMITTWILSAAAVLLSQLLRGVCSRVIAEV